MKKRSNRLEREFVDTAMLIFARQLWHRFPIEAVFLITLPTEELPLVASFMGMGSDQPGLTISRGEGALDRFIQMGEDEEATFRMVEQSDMFCVCFDYWREIPDAFRRTVLDSGKSFSRNAMAPLSLARKPYEANRAAGRADLRNLIWIMRGILQAEAAGSFVPFPVDLLEREIFQLEIDGKPKRPTTAVSTVDWPEAAIDIPDLIMLPSELETLPQGTDRWLVGRMQTPPIEQGDDRNGQLFLVAVEDGPILGSTVSLGDDLSSALDMLTETLLCEAPELEQRALPKEILFNDERLFGAMAPALASLSIQAKCDPDAPNIDSLFEALMGSMEMLLDREGLDEQEESGESGEYDTFLYWKQVFANVTELLVEIVSDKTQISGRALKCYFGDANEGEALLESKANLGIFPSLMEWFLTDYRATKRSKTIIEKQLGKKTLDDDMRHIMEAREMAIVSIFRVDETDVDEGTLEVQDVLTGDTFTLYDKGLAGSGLEGFFLPLRLTLIRSWIFPLLAGPPMSELQIHGALDFLDNLSPSFAESGLDLDTHFLGRLWAWHDSYQPPELTNTDGDPLEFYSASFQVVSQPGLHAALEKHPDMDFNDHEGAWVWRKSGGPGGFGEFTILAHLNPMGGRLLVEVNSKQRLAKIRKWLERISGVTFESASIQEGNERPLDDRLPAQPEAPLEPEFIEQMQALMLEQAERWLNLNIPALAGKTPRQACKTAKGRKQVAAMIRSMPPMMTPSGPIPAPMEELMRELGIR